MVKLNNACIVNFNYTVLVYGPFLTYEWAVLDVAVGRFGPGYGPFLPFALAVLVRGPFWYRPHPVVTQQYKYTAMHQCSS